MKKYQSTLKMARQHLPGNKSAYARVMAGAIRAASSVRAVSYLTDAIKEDGCADMFETRNNVISAR